MRRTVAKDIEFTGIGLHEGKPVWMTVAPALAGTGITFLRIDQPDGAQIIPARYDMVSDTTLCTRLTNEQGVSVGTVEHIMAALAGCGITDAMVALDGPEVPIMDGSSQSFVSSFVKTGFTVLAPTSRAIRILAAVEVESGGRIARLEPSETFEMDFAIDFADQAIGQQHRQITLKNGAFVHELSDCRTFGHLAEVEHLRRHGLARGGSLANAIVVDQGRVLNPEGLRRPDEFVRHKMLDAVGDLALAGAPIVGRYVGRKAGHEMTNRLLHALFANPEAWVWETIAADATLGGGIDDLRQIETLSPVAV
ncbi:MAG: UDP-3-O-acyl-N-acetylglucosamine deacetylase [Pseudomonadota bacterium]